MKTAPLLLAGVLLVTTVVGLSRSRCRSRSSDPVHRAHGPRAAQDGRLDIVDMGLGGGAARYTWRGQVLVLEAMRDRSLIGSADGAILTEIRLRPCRSRAALAADAEEAVVRTQERLAQLEPPTRALELLALSAAATDALTDALTDARASGEVFDLWGFDLHVPVLTTAIHLGLSPAWSGAPLGAGDKESLLSSLADAWVGSLCPRP